MDRLMQLDISKYFILGLALRSAETRTLAAALSILALIVLTKLESRFQTTEGSPKRLMVSNFMND